MAADGVCGYPFPAGSLHPVTLAIAGKGRLFELPWDDPLTPGKDRVNVSVAFVMIAIGYGTQHRRY
jgi:hypothetical protein